MAFFSFLCVLAGKCSICQLSALERSPDRLTNARAYFKQMISISPHPPLVPRHSN